MARRTKEQLAILALNPPEGGSMRRVTDEPWIKDGYRVAPSVAVVESLRHCQERIRLTVHYSVLKAMPMLRNLEATASATDQEEAITKVVAELVRQVIDEGECNVTENCGLFSVEVALADQSGKEYAHRARNRFGIEVEVYVPLEYCVVEAPGRHYAKLRKTADKWLVEDEEASTEP